MINLVPFRMTNLILLLSDTISMQRHGEIDPKISFIRQIFSLLPKLPDIKPPAPSQHSNREIRSTGVNSDRTKGLKLRKASDGMLAAHSFQPNFGV